MNLKKKIIITALIVLLGIVIGIGILYSTNKKPSAKPTNKEQEKNTQDFHVYLNSNNEETYDPIPIDCSKETIIDIIPFKEGHAFLGWYYETGEAFTPTTICEDITLYAHWEDKQVETETNKNEQTINGGQNTNTKNNKKASTKKNNKNGVTGNYKVITIKRTYDKTNAPSRFKNYKDAVDTIGSGANYNPGEMPYEEGYKFLGYYYNGKVIPKTGIVFNGDTTEITIVGKWEAEKTTVKFDSNGGSSVPSIEVGYEETFTLPQAPKRAGYTFIGWRDENNGPSNRYELPGTPNCYHNNYRYNEFKKGGYYKAYWAKTSNRKIGLEIPYIYKNNPSAVGNGLGFGYQTHLNEPALNDGNTIIYTYIYMEDNNYRWYQENTSGDKLQNGIFGGIRWIKENDSYKYLFKIVNNEKGIEEIVGPVTITGKYLTPSISVSGNNLHVFLPSASSVIEVYSSNTQNGEYSLYNTFKTYENSNGYISCNLGDCYKEIYVESGKYYKVRFKYDSDGFANNPNDDVHIVSDFSNIVYKQN